MEPLIAVPKNFHERYMSLKYAKILIFTIVDPSGVHKQRLKLKNYNAKQQENLKSNISHARFGRRTVFELAIVD
jgi:hypothetical protein